MRRLFHDFGSCIHASLSEPGAEGTNGLLAWASRFLSPAKISAFSHKTANRRPHRQPSQACLARFAGRSPSVGAIIVTCPAWLDKVISLQTVNR
jgi:hypothetical protein